MKFQTNPASSFYFSETVQVSSNQGSINPQQNKNQQPRPLA